MSRHTIRMRWAAAFFAGSFCMTFAHSTDAPGIVGKDDWLFYRYELSEPADAAQTKESIELIGRLNKVLVANGVSMAVAMVPLKMRLYAEHLPDSIKLSDYVSGNYESMRKSLEAAGVAAIDLNGPFLVNAKRNPEATLFFRLDTHWTLTGAMLAAETIKAGVEANATLKKALDSTPAEAFSMSVGKRQRPSKGRDLIDQLPPNSGTFAPEQFLPVSVIRAQAPTEELLGNHSTTGIALVGSSYSRDWTGFVDGLRYTLQRDILSVAVGADQGSWVGLESYLRDDAFQTNTPKLLIWEMPERDMRAPPDYRFRDARYVVNNTEWLLKASAWVQRSCKPSTVTAKVASVGLGTQASHLKGNDVTAGPTNENEFIEFAFDKPIDKLDYLVANVLTAGSKNLIIEGSGPGVATRRFTLQVAGDEATHALKTPLPSISSGFTKFRVYPGKTQRFSFQQLQLCRQPEDLLK